MWQGRTVSVVLPTFNERGSVRESIEEFFATGVVDEVIVVNNNAVPGTSEEVSQTKARDIFEPRQGYGFAIRRGLAEASGFYVAVSEPDATFAGQDIWKLLTYADDFDVVYGTRTSRQLIWRGANMGFSLRWGNWAMAKLMQVLFNTTSLTDVGCTMRLIRRPALEVILPLCKVGGNFFGPEMMLLSLTQRMRVIQIPVNYRPRVGRSSVTGSFHKAFILACQMLWLILTFRLRTWFKSAPSATTDLSQEPDT